jgi:hypothetical protein
MVSIDIFQALAMSHKFYIFSLKSVGRLVRWSPLLIEPVLGSSPKQARKEEKKSKYTFIFFKLLNKSAIIFVLL